MIRMRLVFWWTAYWIVVAPTVPIGALWLVLNTAIEGLDWLIHRQGILYPLEKLSNACEQRRAAAAAELER